MESPNAYNSKMFPAQAKLHQTYLKSVNAVQTLEELGISLPDGTIGVEFLVATAGTVYFGVGEATVANAALPQYARHSVWATKAELSVLKFFASSSTSVSFFVYTGG